MKTETRGRPPKLKNPVKLDLRCEAQDKSTWKQAATDSGQTLTEWVIDAAQQKASKQASPSG